ncbi:chitin deacetylase isoform A [Elysia marginata]|uniref:Chitin deacetylase isoform A n=1 Tax=Elysia marginata TaxID=1093978 RepID=A0AAV4EDW2_9GAST|nr:chitin deacetylase isoform A [Elysia marginata]
MRGRTIVLKHNTPSQESRSFATNSISKKVKSAAVLGSIDTLTLWQNVLEDHTFRIPEHCRHHFSCGPLHFELFGHGRGWMFPNHGVALWGIQMGPSFITSNQIVKIGYSLLESLHQAPHQYASYDATLTYSFPKNLYSPVLWPFTLDFGYTLVCNIARCPQNFYKGLWEIPVVGVMDYREHKLCAYVDDCLNMPRDKNDAYQMLWKNFLRNYRSNRAPLYLNLHSPWLTTDYQLDAMDEFIQKMVSMEDVYLVTMSQALAWQKHPTPMDKLADFRPWQCPGFQPHAEDSRQCSFTFRHKTAPGRSHGTGIETIHSRRRAQLQNNLLKNQQPSESKLPTSNQRRKDDVDKTNVRNEGEAKKHKTQIKSTSHVQSRRNGKEGHLYHHHDHRTHKPWFLRSSSSTLTHYGGFAIVLMALVNASQFLGVIDYPVYF